MDDGAGRLLNVSLLAGSPAQRAYYGAGLPPRTSLNLRFFGGKTIAGLVFANRYLGGAAAWDPADIASIDAGLVKAMSDNGLQSVIQQYFDVPVGSRMLRSAVLAKPAPAVISKDQLEALAARVFLDGGLDGADPGRTVVNLMLPRGVVLADGADVDSRQGLGGYHGSVQVAPCGTVYYAAGVYSESGNGIPVFDRPWKNIVATFYHQLNEARTDPDVDDAIRTGDRARLGWYSPPAGEIGDIPVLHAGATVFQDVDLADGSGTVPVQLMWSNHHAAPATHLP
jgi:hypothetical protein